MTKCFISRTNLSLLCLFWLMVSCTSQKQITYFQDINSKSVNISDSSVFQDPMIKSGDLISIKVTSLNLEANQFFTFSIDKSPGNVPNYLVDSKGCIEVPLIGEVRIIGLTISAAKDTLKKRLEKYLDSPSVMIRYENFKISVLGEVLKPGLYSIPTERINLLEALGLAGDLTIYANRKNVMLIREQDGKREFNNIDLTSSNLFYSKYYYLRSNDIIYVEPGKSKINSTDNFYRVMPIVMSALSVLSIFITRINF